MTRKILLSFLIVLSALFVYGTSGEESLFIDRYADDYFSETISEASIAYATVRGVNAVVSVLKESQVEVSPAGVGINIAAGQILDPIDDMTERLSSVLVTALVSLGIQKLVMEITQLAPPLVMALLLLLLLIPLWLPLSQPRFPTRLLLQWTVILLALRLFLPFSSFTSTILYNNLIKDEILESQKKLESIAQSHQSVKSFYQSPEDSHVLSFTRGIREKTDRLKNLFTQISENIDEVISALLNLTILYVSVFLIQVIVIPVGVLWIMISMFNSLVRFSLFSVMPPHQRQYHDTLPPPDEETS